jgi:hypothetical protein
MLLAYNDISLVSRILLEVYQWYLNHGLSSTYRDHLLLLILLVLVISTDRCIQLAILRISYLIVCSKRHLTIDFVLS